MVPQVLRSVDYSKLTNPMQYRESGREREGQIEREREQEETEAE